MRWSYELSCWISGLVCSTISHTTPLGCCQQPLLELGLDSSQEVIATTTTTWRGIICFCKYERRMRRVYSAPSLAAADTCFFYFSRLSMHLLYSVLQLHFNFILVTAAIHEQGLFDIFRCWWNSSQPSFNMSHTNHFLPPASSWFYF